MENFKCVENLSWKDLGDHVVILDSQNKQMVHHLEEVAGLIWKSVDKLMSSEAIIQAICLEYEIEEKAATQDFMNFTQSLLEQELLEKK